MKLIVLLITILSLPAMAESPPEGIQFMTSVPFKCIDHDGVEDASAQNKTKSFVTLSIDKLPIKGPQIFFSNLSRKSNEDHDRLSYHFFDINGFERDGEDLVYTAQIKVTRSSKEDGNTIAVHAYPDKIRSSKVRLVTGGVDQGFVKVIMSDLPFKDCATVELTDLTGARWTNYPVIFQESENNGESADETAQ